MKNQAQTAEEVQIEQKQEVTDTFSSRLIAKNLPGTGKNKWDEQRIRTFFGRFGKITDVKMKMNEKTGACRFAFVGFDKNESCRKAIEKLNGSFLHGTKLTVEECKPLTKERQEISRKFTLLKWKQNAKEDAKSELEDPSVNSSLRNKILDSGRLFLRNLPFTCTEDCITNLFKPFGPLAEVECIVDRNGQCKGYALCTFMFPEHALTAWEQLDGKIFMGRMLHIIAGEEKVKKVDQNVQGKHLSSFQRDRLANRKEQAGTTAHTWNSFFLGSNAVADTLVENYEVEKKHLLMGQGENSAAVRVAMGETQLVRETRKFLLDHGLKLDAFSRLAKNVKRSKTTILVKNLSGKRGEKERLQRMFARYGDVKNVILPPAHGISALVEMGNELDAKHAFEGLAYAKDATGSGRPFYLEWAPVDVFDESHPSRNKKTPQHSEGEEKDERGEEKDGQEEKKEEEERTKMLVRNVPFQANQNEITQLFSAFGELKFVRMPKKPNSSGHRGFCFVDFISVADARRAMDSLVHSTHLYGRRLVLEWAKKDEEAVDELREKTKRKSAHTLQTGKKTKMRSFAD